MFSTIQFLLWTAIAYAKTVWLTIYTKTICSAFIYAMTVFFGPRNESGSFAPEDVLAQIKAIQGDHETARLLQKLIETGGGGSWPPRSSHGDAWPTALRPYHNIYLELAPLLPAREVSLDADVNSKRRLIYRTHMRKLLHDHVDLSAVEAILSAIETGDEPTLAVDACNGFFACIAISRHSFR